MRGNVLDMAVGVIIGGAFGKIVSSVVDDVIMPPIGWLIGGVNFSDLKITLPTVNVAGEELKAATINYGNFLQTCLDFLIVAFCIFMLIKVVNKIAKKKEEPKEPETPKAPEPSNEEKLLTEIRDLLKNQAKPIIGGNTRHGNIWLPSPSGRQTWTTMDYHLEGCHLLSTFHRSRADEQSRIIKPERMEPPVL